MSTPPQQGGAGLDRYIPTVPADWAPPVRTVQDALDQLGGRSGGAGFATSYVWRPGGVATPGVYVTWAALVAAFVTVDNAARKIVSVDDSLGNAHITTGAWAVENVEFRSGGNDLANDDLATVNIDDGATFTGTHHLAFDGVNVVDAATTTSLITTPANNDLALDLRACVFEQTGVGGPGIITLGAGSELSLRMYAVSVFGDGTHPVVAGSATSGVLAFCYCESVFSANAVNLAVGGATVIEADGSCVISATQTPAPTVVILDPTPTLIFQPGGTPAGNLFTTWATLYAQASLYGPGLTVIVDDSIAAAHMTAGGPYNLQGWVLRGMSQTPATLIIDPGASISASTTQLEVQNLIVSNQTTAAPAWTPGAGAQLVISQDDGQVLSTTAQPFLHVTAAASFTVVSLNVLGAEFGDGAHAAMSVDAGQTGIVQLNGGTLLTDAVAGAGTLNVTVAAGSPGNVPAQTVTTVNTFYVGFAKSNSQVAVGNTGTGGGTVTVTTPAITKAKNGKMLVNASCLLSTSAAASTLTVQLKRDAANIGTAKTLVVPATGIPTGIDVSIDAIDTAPDNAAHTYTLSVSVSAGTLTVAANSAQIQVVEDS
jgi:hypothetical protein